FEHWQSAPRKLDTAVSMAIDGTLVKIKQLCDFKVLDEALQERTAWLSQLRADDGIRDILIHKAHLLMIGCFGTQSPQEQGTRWGVWADLMSYKQGALRGFNLFPTLIDCINGACRFMDGLYQCASTLTGYVQEDVLFLTGSDNDIVGFWPPIH